MSFPSAKNYVSLLTRVVNNMDIPYWYSREEAISTGYLAMRSKLSQYSKKKHNCSVETYLSNVVRQAVRNEQRDHRTHYKRMKQIRDALNEFGIENE